MFKIEDHEKNINDLSQFLKIDGIDQAKVSTILQSLRENYTEVNTALTDNTKQITEFTQLNEGLRSANMTLLSKLGTSISDFKPRGQEPPKEDPQKQDAKSLDDLALEFLK